MCSGDSEINIVNNMRKEINQMIILTGQKDQLSNFQ